MVLDGFTGIYPGPVPGSEEDVHPLPAGLCDRYSGPEGGSVPKDGPQRLFHMTRKMIRKLTETAAEAGTEVLAPLWVLPERQAGSPQVRPLLFWNRICSATAKKSGKENSRQSLFAPRKHRRWKCSMWRETIRRLIREKGCRFRDFAVVAGSLDDYGKRRCGPFPAAEFPCFIDEKKPALANPFVEWIRAAVDMAVQSYSYESVFRYLRCGFSGSVRKIRIVWKNYVVALGIHGRKQYEERWVRNYRGQKPEETKN